MNTILQESIQHGIDHIRKVAKTKPESARDLINTYNYTIRRVRVVIDCDCDFTELGDRYRVSFEMPDSGNSFIIQDFDTVTEAATLIEAIGRALDTSDGFAPSGHSMRTGGSYPKHGSYGMRQIK